MNAPILTRLDNVDSLTRLRTYAPVGQPDECWEWTRGKNKGYGTIRTDDARMRNAHVVAWEIHTGQALPIGMIIRHTCDNPPCTNPAHLLLGTHADNVADKVARNRQDKGEKHGMSKLTEGQVREIRARCAAGEWQKNVGHDYGIKQANVSSIIRGKTWGHVK